MTKIKICDVINMKISIMEVGYIYIYILTVYTLAHSCQVAMRETGLIVQTVYTWYIVIMWCNMDIIGIKWVSCVVPVAGLPIMNPFVLLVDAGLNADPVAALIRPSESGPLVASAAYQVTTLTAFMRWRVIMTGKWLLSLDKLSLDNCILNCKSWCERVNWWLL